MESREFDVDFEWLNMPAEFESSFLQMIGIDCDSLSSFHVFLLLVYVALSASTQPTVLQLLQDEQEGAVFDPPPPDTYGTSANLMTIRLRS